MASYRSPKDFVLQLLSPLVAVVSSPDADDLCKANLIPSIAEFLRPLGSRIEGKGKKVKINYYTNSNNNNNYS